MPETITRQERLDAIVSLLPPRKIVEGRPQPYNSKAYNTIADLLEMVRNDMVVIQGLENRVGMMRPMVEGKGNFGPLPDIPKPAKLTVDLRAHTLLHLAWLTSVSAGHTALAKEIQLYLLGNPEVVQENLVT